MKRRVTKQQVKQFERLLKFLCKPRNKREQDKKYILSAKELKKLKEDIRRQCNIPKEAK